jgi:hypothetical protein
LQFDWSLKSIDLLGTECIWVVGRVHLGLAGSLELKEETLEDHLFNNSVLIRIVDLRANAELLCLQCLELT